MLAVSLWLGCAASGMTLLALSIGWLNAKLSSVNFHVISAHTCCYASLLPATIACCSHRIHLQSHLSARPLSSCRPQELRLLLQHLVSSGFASSTTSPLQRCRQLRWLFYSFTGALAQQQHAALSAAEAADLSDPVAAAAAGAAAAAALTSTGDLAWQDIWSDALSYALVLASELVLNPGFSSEGLQALLGPELLPPQFVDVASTVAAAQLSSAAQQLQVQRQLQALAFWQRYGELDKRYQQWKDDWAGALAAVGDAAVLGNLAEQGQQLAGDMLQQAMQDELRLPACVELLGLLAATAAAAADGAADAESYAAALAAAGVELEEGEWMALPKFDDGEEMPAELLLALTVASDKSSGADPDLPFVQLEVRKRAGLCRHSNRLVVCWSLVQHAIGLLWV
jgi:hypothetical protein